MPVVSSTTDTLPVGNRRASLAFQSISPGDDFEFAADSFFDRDDGMHLEHECREHRAESSFLKEVIFLI